MNRITYNDKELSEQVGSEIATVALNNILNSPSQAKSAALHCPKSAQQIASAHGVSRRSIFQIKAIRTRGAAELYEAVKSGLIGMSQGEEMLIFSHDAQRMILEELAADSPRERAGVIKFLIANAKHEALVAAGKLPPDDMAGIAK